MSSNVLEQIRLNHEASEKLDEAIGLELDQKPHGQKAKVWQQHRVKAMCDNIAKLNSELKNMYNDDDSLLKDELAGMKGQNMFISFYDQLKSTREYYHKHPNSVVDQSSIVDVDVDVKFSGEEVFGKYLDLHQLFLKFCNITHKLSIEQDYIQYLDRFSSYFFLSDAVKSTSEFCEYLVDLWNYLEDFFKRVNPLINLHSIVKEWEIEYASKHKPSSKSQSNDIHNKSNPQPLKLTMFHSATELEALGPDRLKEALEAIGVKCGGTLHDRAERLWAVRGLKVDEIPEKLKAKPNNKKKSEDKKEVKHDHKWLEYRIGCICELLSEVISATRKHAIKQQTRTTEEKEQEIFEEEFGLLPDIEENNNGSKAVTKTEDDEPLYNPKNIPLGWDGKPIPYWLYKLHGLGIEYKCEICGNHSYWGRKAFERHFQEWKHSYGMKCLGIPNTKHFHDITSIGEVLALYNKIKDTVHLEQFSQELEEEFEDTEGNVLNRRTYEDLARQGLL